MNRRRFAGALAGFAALPVLAADESRRTRYYSFEKFRYKRTPQSDRVNDWLSKEYLPRLAKLHPGPSIALSASIAPHVPETLLITGYSSIDEFAAIRSKLAEDTPSGAEAPFDTQENSLIEAYEFSPEIAISKHDPARYFELRVYHAPGTAQLRALHDRFAGGEIKIFHKVGIHPILYGSTLIGPNLPNLVYLIPFDTLAARETAWNAFGADPDWIKLSRDFTAKYGSVPTTSDLAIYRAAPFSPVS
jgi:hypothetical protein